jgi:protein tyrosine phosphatase
VLPFDATRVELTGALGHGSGGDYINASWVAGAAGRPRAYIAAQGPLENTAEHFWQMVAERGSPAVVMLTGFEEPLRPQPKCHRYFPEEAGTRAAFGPWSVETLSVERLRPGLELRHMQLERRGAGAPGGAARASGDPGGGGFCHRLQHFHCLDWEDFGVPATSEGTRALSRRLRNLVPEVEGAAAPVVHCSAGIGRTGVFCALDIALREVYEGLVPPAQAVDVARSVAALRRARGGMVQTPEQYLFIYRALIEDLRASHGGP